MTRSAVRLTLVAIAGLCTLPAAHAEDSAGLQVLIDMQDPAQISKTFCVHESKLYSVEAQLCVSSNVKLTCALVDEKDASKGVIWKATDEKTRCR